MQTPAYWDGARWIIQSISPLSPGQLRRVGAFLLKVQKQRRAGLSPGAVRDECDETIRALEAGRIVCGLQPEYSGPDGQMYAPFAATAAPRARVISLGVP